MKKYLLWQKRCISISEKVKWIVDVYSCGSIEGRTFPVNTWDFDNKEDVVEAVSNCLRSIAGIDKIVIEKIKEL